MRENVTADLALKLAPNRGERRAKIRAMTPEQLHAFLRAADKAEPEWSVGLRVGALCGPRPGELLGLRWGDVDFHGSQLHVRRAFTRSKIKSTKTGEDRKVDVPPGLLEGLRHELASAKARALAAGEKLSVYVLPSTRGTPRDDGYLRQAMQRVLTKAGLPDVFTPHCLRHTYATQHLLAGTSIYYVQKQLGHASIQMTVDLYGSWLPSGNAENAARLESRVTGSVPTPAPPESPTKEKAKVAWMPKNDPSSARGGR